MLTRSALRASSGSTPNKEAQPSATSTPQRGAVKRKYVKRKPLEEKQIPPFKPQSPIFNIHIHVHSSNGDSIPDLSQVPSIHVHLDDYKTQDSSAKVKKRPYRKRNSTISTIDNEQSDILALTSNDSLQNATETVSLRSTSDQRKINLQIDVNKNSEANNSCFINLKNSVIQDNVEVTSNNSKGKETNMGCDIIDQVNDNTHLSLSREIITDSDSDCVNTQQNSHLAINKIIRLDALCSNSETSSDVVKEITATSACANLSPSKRSLKSMNPRVVLKDIFKSKGAVGNNICGKEKTEELFQGNIQQKKTSDVGDVEEKNNSSVLNERSEGKSSKETSQKKDENEKEKSSRTLSSQCDSDSSEKTFSSPEKSNESANLKNGCRGTLSSSDLDLLNASRDNGEFYTFVYESENNETEKYIVDKKIDSASATSNFSDLVNKCKIKGCNGKYVVLTSFEDTQRVDETAKKSPSKNVAEDSRCSDLKITKDQCKGKNKSNESIKSGNADVSETEKEVTNEPCPSGLDHAEDIIELNTDSDTSDEGRLVVVEDNLNDEKKPEKLTQEPDDETNLTRETLQKDEKEDKSSNDESHLDSDSSTEIVEISFKPKNLSPIDSVKSNSLKDDKGKLIESNLPDTKQVVHRRETPTEEVTRTAMKNKVKTKKKSETKDKNPVSGPNQRTKQIKKKNLKRQKKNSLKSLEDEKSAKKFFEEQNYLPLDVSGSTKFAVADVKKIKPYEKHDAFSFRKMMLYGDRVKRFPESSSLQVYKMKQKAAKKCE